MAKKNENIDQDNFQIETNNSVDAKIVNQYVNQLEKFFENPQHINKLTKLIISLNKSKPVKAMRFVWDKTPKVIQYGMLNASEVVGPDFLGYLVKTGIIEYKGFKNEDKQIMEAKINALGGQKKVFRKYGIKYGQYFFPELKVLSPLEPSFERIDKLQDKVTSKIRKSVRESNEESKILSENIEDITNLTRQNIKSTLNN